MPSDNGLFVNEFILATVYCYVCDLFVNGHIYRLAINCHVRALFVNGHRIASYQLSRSCKDVIATRFLRQHGEL